MGGGGGREEGEHTLLASMRESIKYVHAFQHQTYTEGRLIINISYKHSTMHEEHELSYAHSSLDRFVHSFSCSPMTSASLVLIFRRCRSSLCNKNKNNLILRI